MILRAVAACWRKPQARGDLGLLAFAIVALAMPSLASAQTGDPADTKLVSSAPTGDEGNHFSSPGVISGDGRYIAYSSMASNLVDGDVNGTFDAFVYDRTTGRNELISVASDGSQGNGPSFLPTISHDGRFVAFASTASNLAADDSGFTQDLFIHDRETGQTERITRGESEPAEVEYWSPKISADGDRVAYQRRSKQEGTGFTWDEVFVYDRIVEESKLVSVSSAGDPVDNLAASPAMSANGRVVAFDTGAGNLVAGDDNHAYDVFVHDLVTAETDRVSVNSNGEGGNSWSEDPALSADGRYVAFVSNSSNLVPADRNSIGEIATGGARGSWDIFVHDRTTGRTERVSIGDAGIEGNHRASDPTISADGRFVAFVSHADNLVAGDDNAKNDIFLHDRDTGLTRLVSKSIGGGFPTGASFVPSLDAAGRFVTFGSNANDIVAGTSNSHQDVYVRDLGPAPGIDEMSANVGAGRVEVSGSALFPVGVAAAQGDAGADSLPGSNERGGELIGASLSYLRDAQELIVRWNLARLPETLGVAGDPTVNYLFSFSVGDSNLRVRAINPETFVLEECAPGCIPVRTLKGSVGSGGVEARAAVPLVAAGLNEGSELSEIVAATTNAAAQEGFGLDDVTLPDVRVPVPRVEIALVPGGAPISQAAFSSVELVDSTFSASIDTSDIFGVHDVIARACVGISCGYERTPIDLGPSPSPTETATPTPTESSSPSPSQSPEPGAARVTFTERSAESGQYSDETLFEARLSDSTNDPIAGAELTFELAGADSSRTFTATTNDDGIASVTPTLEEKPSTHQLTVRYAGDIDHEGSADTLTFVVEKEDTDLTITVEGKGNKRTLTARLADRDTAADGIDARAIDFYADGQLIGSATTDADGVAILKPPPRYRGGKHDFEARFEGDDYFRVSSDQDPTG